MCSMCYNTLARANLLMRTDEEKRKTLNDFMEEEPDYSGEVEVLHLLNFLRDEIGWDKVKAAVKVPLDGLKAAPFYGCTLVRPEEVAIDSAENPRFMHDLLSALGASTVDLPNGTDCCGAYQMISHPDASIKAVANIIGPAEKREADAVVTACPLCEYNLGMQQSAVLEKHSDLKAVPTFYFTQLMAVAMGVDAQECCFGLNMPGAKELLEEKKYLVSA